MTAALSQQRLPPLDVMLKFPEMLKEPGASVLSGPAVNRKNGLGSGMLKFTVSPGPAVIENEAVSLIVEADVGDDSAVRDGTYLREDRPALLQVIDALTFAVERRIGIRRLSRPVAGQASNNDARWRISTCGAHEANAHRDHQERHTESPRIHFERSQR